MPAEFINLLLFHVTTATIVFAGGVVLTCLGNRRFHEHDGSSALLGLDIRCMKELFTQSRDLLWLLMISLSWPLLLCAAGFLYCRSAMLRHARTASRTLTTS